MLLFDWSKPESWLVGVTEATPDTELHRVSTDNPEETENSNPVQWGIFAPWGTTITQKHITVADGETTQHHRDPAWESERDCYYT